MGFFKHSPTSGALPKVRGVIPTLYFLSTTLGVLALFLVNLYVPCLRLSNPALFNPVVTGVLLTVHALLLGLSMWCLVLVKCTNPGYVVRPNKLTAREVRDIEAGKLEYNPPLTHELMAREFAICDAEGNHKYCPTCKILRPARATHCKELGRCVIKLDHFCPFLFSAIGVGNYKYFMHFILWTLALAMYLQVLAWFAVGTIRESGAGRGWFIGLGTLASFIADVGLLPLVSLHMTLIFDNVTTREDIGPQTSATPGKSSNAQCCQLPENPGARLFVRCNLEHYPLRYKVVPPADCKFVVVTLDVNSEPWRLDSRWANWCSVMGTKWWQWVFPFKPTRKEVQGRKFWEFEFNERTMAELREKANEQLVKMKEKDDDSPIPPVLVKGS